MLPGELREHSPAHVLSVADDVWLDRDNFIKWPGKSLLFMPGVSRSRIKYYDYNLEQKYHLKCAGIRADRRSNGPAIMAFLLAGGERPKRENKNREWSIHHIYDGKYPWPNTNRSVHAVQDGSLFTESAGLVAVHPIADALADEVPFFAWLLRLEAYKRFDFDPDNVFRRIA